MYKLLLAAFIVIPSLVRAQGSLTPDSSTLVKVGQIIPDFSFELEKGKTAHIADYRNKILVINFFATWCPPCNAELPVLHKNIWEKYRNDPRFALLIFGREEGWEKVTGFKNAHQFTFAMLPDEGRKIFALFATQYIPRTLLIDQTGKVVYESTGYSEEEFGRLESAVASLLK